MYATMHMDNIIFESCFLLARTSLLDSCHSSEAGGIVTQIQRHRLSHYMVHGIRVPEQKQGGHAHCIKCDRRGEIPVIYCKQWTEMASFFDFSRSNGISLFISISFSLSLLDIMLTGVFFLSFSLQLLMLILINPVLKRKQMFFLNK